MKRFDVLDLRRGGLRLGRELRAISSWTSLDKDGAMLVRQEMVQPLAKEESMN